MSTKAEKDEIARVEAQKKTDAAANAVANPAPPRNRRKALVDRRADSDPVVPDLDYEELKKRAAFAKPRNEALHIEVTAKLAEASKAVTEAAELLGKWVHVEA